MSIYDLRGTDLNGLWHLVGALEGREQLFIAAQTGHLASIESARRYAGLSGGLDIRSIHFDRKMGAFEVSVQDSAGKEITLLSHGSGLEGEMCLWRFRRRVPPNVRIINSGHIDSRYAITILESALHHPLLGEHELRQRFSPTRDGMDLLQLLDDSVNDCKKWFLERDKAVGSP